MTSTQHTPHRRTPIWLLILIAVVPAAIVAAVLQFRWYTKPISEGIALSHQQAMQITGLGKTVSNKLDPRFTDADNDLVADPPTDAAKLVDPAVIHFSYVVADDPDLYKNTFKEFAAHLSKVTGRQVDYVVFASTNDQLKAMRDGTLHIAGLNTGSVPIAVDLCGFIPVCKLATADGVASYRMQLIVPADSPIKAPPDLKKKELTVTDPGSNSGYKAALVMLHNEHQMDPERDYLLRFSGGHDESIKGIASRSYQAATVAGDVLKRGIAKGDIKATDFRVIYESELFPTACFGYAHNLKPELAAKLKEAMMSFPWTGTAMEAEFAKSGQSRLVPANFKDDWAIVRRIDEQMGAQYKLD